ncbi:PREDICTED: uncharacterized protein LOC108768558 [Trachymyrmex cornetzi]|uniref:uncharacterized protein LOC108768558 n=1 Tax=Trachymyrmex cornetzi TaxID=471704 RepID=UPI00084F4F5B|nr:PREDICTED: uncharacterized protein LOC108768558 [Trachymyrmex cornetzi]
MEHGTPEKILTDQGTNFTSEMFKNTCKLLQIEKIQTTAYHPERFTPFELMYGHQAILPTALTRPPKTTYSYEDYAQELRERIRATNQVAREHAQAEKIKAKRQYDKSARKEKFEVGDKVLLYDETGIPCMEAHRWNVTCTHTYISLGDVPEYARNILRGNRVAESSGG